MGKQRVLTDRHPQILSAPSDITDLPACQRCREVLRTSQMPARGPRMEDFDARERAPADVPLQTDPDALYLWQLRHSPLGILAKPGAWLALGPRRLDQPGPPRRLRRLGAWHGLLPPRSSSG